MTTTIFSRMTPQKQVEYLKSTGTLLHRIFKGDLMISLYWTEELIFEVLTPKNMMNSVEIRCYDRFKYVET